MKVIDDGVEIVLAGKNTDGMFVWSVAMLVCALVVAIICFTLPVPYAISAVGVWAVLMYFFNQKKHIAKTQKHHAQGVLIIKNHHFSINGMSTSLSKAAQISSEGKHLIINDDGASYYFGGFAGEHEIDVAKAVLNGQSIVKRTKTIKMSAG
ncbi:MULTISPECIES: hypothetical protein [unclassified Moraxella]|uniref:hypothetical protein n=1 Tax=unclassified Moraxella TaxID=2685852 RepID=UPI002B414B3D|nr:MULTISPECIES: hypothetical protein [unclassified Moraxella]